MKNKQLAGEVKRRYVDCKHDLRQTKVFTWQLKKEMPNVKAGDKLEVIGFDSQMKVVIAVKDEYIAPNTTFHSQVNRKLDPFRAKILSISKYCFGKDEKGFTFIDLSAFDTDEFEETYFACYCGELDAYFPVLGDGSVEVGKEIEVGSINGQIVGLVK